MPDDPPILRETTARTFIKDRTGKRVREVAVDLFVTHFTTIAEAVAGRAAELADAEERTTILWRDIDTAYNELLQAGTLVGPGAIHTAIDMVSNEDLGELIQLLRADVATPTGTPP